jgi:hypothetical protein
MFSWAKLLRIRQGIEKKYKNKGLEKFCNRKLEEANREIF